MHVSLFPLREETTGDSVCAPLLPRHHAPAQHLQGEPTPNVCVIYMRVCVTYMRVCDLCVYV